MKSLFLTIAIFFSILQSAIATHCPPPPIPLRQLIQQSEFIVIGSIGTQSELKMNFTHGNPTEIKIQQVLQGNIQIETIPMHLDLWSLEQSHLHPEEEVYLMAFLNYSEEKQLFIPTSYQSSYKFLDKQGKMAYQQRIKEFHAIQSLKDEKRRELLTTDWLISCAENQYTHWEGAYDLSPYSQYMRHYDEALEDYVQKLVLNKNQIQRIRALVLDLKEIDFVDVGLIDIIEGWQDPEVLQIVVNFLKSVDQKYLWQQDYLIRRVAYGSQREDLIKTLEEINSWEYQEGWEEQHNTLLLSVLNQL